MIITHRTATEPVDSVWAGSSHVQWDSAAVAWHLPPPRTVTPPGARQDFRRRLAGAFLHLRPAAIAAGLCLYFPAVTVGAYVDVATPTRGPVTVPPMALDSHLLNVWGSSRAGNTGASAFQAGLAPDSYCSPGAHRYPSGGRSGDRGGMGAR
jgi:hypothetical protein